MPSVRTQSQSICQVELLRYLELGHHHHCGLLRLQSAHHLLDCPQDLQTQIPTALPAQGLAQPHPPTSDQSQPSSPLSQVCNCSRWQQWQLKTSRRSATHSALAGELQQQWFVHCSWLQQATVQLTCCACAVTKSVLHNKQG